MCENQCVFSESDSTATEAVCKLPPLSTSKSISTYKIVQPKILNSGKYITSGTEANVKKVFDLNNMNYYEDDSAPCYAGMQFREGYVGILSKVRFFLGDKYEMTKFAGLTKFQGSQDGNSYDDLFTFDENVHTGWNYHEWNETSQPKYRYYRIYGDTKNQCAVTEAELTGVETIDDSQDTYSCTPKLYVDSELKDLTDQLKT